MFVMPCFVKPANNLQYWEIPDNNNTQTVTLKNHLYFTRLKVDQSNKSLNQSSIIFRYLTLIFDRVVRQF
jgi:hypothetical protein